MLADSGSEPIHVILADSHPLALTGLRALLETQSDITILAAVTDGMQFVETVRRNIGHVDLLVMAFDLPIADGRACLEYIRWQGWAVKVIVLTPDDDGEAIRQALEFGAEGVVPKNASLEQILTTLRQVEAGQMVFPDSARRWLTVLPSPLHALSEREEDVLALLSEGFTNAQIAERLVLSENTIKFHLKNIYQKLGTDNRTGASSVYLRQTAPHQTTPD